MIVCRLWGSSPKHTHSGRHRRPCG